MQNYIAFPNVISIHIILLLLITACILYKIDSNFMVLNFGSNSFNLVPKQNKCACVVKDVYYKSFIVVISFIPYLT